MEEITNNILSGLPNTFILGILLYLYTRYEKERSKRLENIENQMGNHIQSELKELRGDIKDILKLLIDIKNNKNK